MKKIQYEIGMVIVSIVIVLCSIFVITDTYQLHTYNNESIEEKVYFIETEQFLMRHFITEQTTEGYQVCFGTLFIKDDEFFSEIEMLDLSISFVLQDEVSKLIEQSVELNLGQEVYELDVLQYDEEIIYDSVQLTLNNLEGFENPISFELEDVYSVSTNVKDYHLVGSFVNDHYMNMGHLLFLNNPLEYTDISIEYRYSEDDFYRVFDKVSCSVEEYLNREYDPIHLHIEDNKLAYETLSMVVILSNEDDEPLVFSIDLEVEGLVYED